MSAAHVDRLDNIWDRLDQLSRDLHSALCANALSARRVSKGEVHQLIERLIGARSLLVLDDGSDERDPKPQWAASSHALDAARRAGFDWE